MNDFEKLLSIVERKFNYDKSNIWSEGSSTYLKEIIKEIYEVNEELEQNRLCYLEDELADILWDYLNILINLKEERNISIESVLQRAIKKYDERISGIENGTEWKNIKESQKMRLEQEYIKSGF